jgi:hypothetical protein
MGMCGFTWVLPNQPTTVKQPNNPLGTIPSNQARSGVVGYTPYNLDYGESPMFPQLLQDLHL